MTGGDECLEECLHGRIIRQAFRVPLDADCKALIFDNQPLNQSIRRKGDGFQTLTDFSYALVVQAVYRDFICLEDLVQEAAWLQADGMGMFISGVIGVPIMFEGVFQLVCDIGVETAAKSHVSTWIRGRSPAGCMTSRTRSIR